MIAALLFFFTVNAAELPKLKLPEEWSSCEQDSDCAVAGDACRSCGELAIIHKKYLKAYAEMDNKARKKAGVTMACEACSTQHVKLSCEESHCGVKRDGQ